MIIKYNKLLKKYNIKVNGILHIGAHECEELHDYLNGGCPKNKIIWIEGNPEIAKKMKIKDPTLRIYNYLVSDKDNINTKLNITNNVQSSSILDLGTHKKHHPEVHFNGSIELKTTTVNSIYNIENLNPTIANFLNIDIQGAELLALKGMGDLITNFDYLYLEVNREHLYVNCALIYEIDAYLTQFNFKRIQTEWTNYNWGDAFYIKQI